MMFKVEKIFIDGVYLISNVNFNDQRGSFVKTFSKEKFSQNDLKIDIKESYYSISKKNVIRGMHFQLPPHDHIKLISVPVGSIQDVVLDLRKKSPTYKKYFSVELSQFNKKSILLPKGIAHGFLSLMENSVTHYSVSSEYNNDLDSGVCYSSFGFDWKIQNPIISDRDLNFLNLEEFCLKNNPF